MQDEQFMLVWNKGHSRFSADLDRGLGHLLERFASREKRAKDIRNSYGIPGNVGRPVLTPAAKASLRGLAASVITAALWVAVMALATPAPGLAATSVAPVAHADRVSHLLLA